MTVIRAGSIATMAIILCCGRLLAQPHNDEPATTTTRDTLCGPRCVRFLLEYYGREQVTGNDLVTLVKELQWPLAEHGSTLLGLQHALNARGIPTKALRIAPTNEIQAETPALVHLTTSDDELGHFVVWLPSSVGSTVDIWSFPAGQLQLDSKVFNADRSTAILATIDPDSPLSAESFAPRWPPLRRVLLSVGCMAIVVLGLWSRRIMVAVNSRNEPLSSDIVTDTPVSNSQET